MELKEIRGLGPARLEAFRAVGIESLRDLFMYLPVRYDDLTHAVPCSTEEPGMHVFHGRILQRPSASWHQGLSKVEAVMEDQSGKLSIIWFNQPWMQKQLHAGMTVTLYGRLAFNKHGRRELQNPEQVTLGQIRPVYKEIQGVPAKILRQVIQTHLYMLPELIEEILPESILREYHFPSRAEAIAVSHEPDTLEDVKAARQRLAFEKMLLYLCMVKCQRGASDPGFALSIPDKVVDEYWNAQPFTPTQAQRRVLAEVVQGLRQNRAMARLIQGDVGCGKTAIAFGAILCACRAGFQAAMMAPTEILARQHYESAKKVLESFGIRCGLLVGSLKASEKKKAHARLEAGEWDAVFGTHALISEGVQYQKLGLVITDEQHRFGVRQRSFLQAKGEQAGRMPHVMVMSATPIPRTLALILYGDLDVSVVDELPAGRKPVQTRLVPENKRHDMYGFLHKEIAMGHQAYVVCPLVEDSESIEHVRSAQSTYEELRTHELRDLRIGLTWGEQKAEEKQLVLDQFARGDLDVLISTTVIEVGINVPNSTVMIIENADRFGLSQLHQLRGRVGRGGDESWCFLVAQRSEKLGIMVKTNDGFEIAQKDLELRGPGELMGTRQSGQESLGFLLDGDVKLLQLATRCIESIYSEDRFQTTRSILEKTAEKTFEGRIGQIAKN